RLVSTLVTLRGLVLLGLLLFLLGLRRVSFRRLLGSVASGGRRDRAGLADVLAGRRRRQGRAGREGEERQADHRVANHLNPPVFVVVAKRDVLGDCTRGATRPVLRIPHSARPSGAARRGRGAFRFGAAQIRANRAG